MITLDLSAVLWSLYVERSALFGAAVVVLPKSLLAAMDRIQRMRGRILLCHSPRSPSPSILAELGWVRWSAQLVFERARLLSRLVESANDLTQLVMGLDAGSARSWAAEVAGSFSSWVSDGMPQEKHEWGQAFSQWKRDARFLEPTVPWKRSPLTRALPITCPSYGPGRGGGPSISFYIPKR